MKLTAEQARAETKARARDKANRAKLSRLLEDAGVVDVTPDMQDYVLAIMEKAGPSLLMRIAKLCDFSIDRCTEVLRVLRQRGKVQQEEGAGAMAKWGVTGPLRSSVPMPQAEPTDDSGAETDEEKQVKRDKRAKAAHKAATSKILTATVTDIPPALDTTSLPDDDPEPDVEPDEDEGDEIEEDD